MQDEPMYHSDSMANQPQDQVFHDIWPDEIKETLIADHGWTQHYDVLKELGDCHTTLGNYDQARICYDKAATIAPDEAGPYIGLGVIALQGDNLEDAETAFRVAIRLDPNSSKAYSGLAMICQRHQNPQDAFDYYLKSLRLNCDDLTALLGLFQVSCEMESFGKVIDYLRTYLDMHPADTSVMFCLGSLYMKENRLEDAEAVLMDLQVFEPENIDAAHLLEEVQHRLAQVVN